MGDFVLLECSDFQFHEIFNPFHLYVFSAEIQVMQVVGFPKLWHQNVPAVLLTEKPGQHKKNVSYAFFTLTPAARSWQIFRHLWWDIFLFQTVNKEQFIFGAHLSNLKHWWGSPYIFDESCAKNERDIVVAPSISLKNCLKFK